MPEDLWCDTARRVDLDGILSLHQWAGFASLVAMISILPGRPVRCMISESPSRSPISLLTIASEPLLAIAFTPD